MQNTTNPYIMARSLPPPLWVNEYARFVPNIEARVACNRRAWILGVVLHSQSRVSSPSKLGFQIKHKINLEFWNKIFDYNFSFWSLLFLLLLSSCLDVSCVLNKACFEKAGSFKSGPNTVILTQHFPHVCKLAHASCKTNQDNLLTKPFRKE